MTRRTLNAEQRSAMSSVHLSPRQALVLAAASDGVPLAVVARRLGTTREQVSARLSEAYRGLGVGWMPRGEKRAEAVAVARRAGLIPAADLASASGRAPGRA